MRNAPEVVREVAVHHFRMATKQQLLHLYSGLLGVAPGAVGVDFWWKGRLRRSVPAPASLPSCRPDLARSRCPTAWRSWSKTARFAENRCASIRSTPTGGRPLPTLG